MPADDTEFDENYAAPGSVLQDPTLPAGNLIMIYHAENHCPAGMWQMPFYATVGFARSSDNGKTWPAPDSGPLGGPSRYAVIQSSDPLPTSPHSALGDAAPSAIVYKSVDGNYYLYVAYAYFSMSERPGGARRARQTRRHPLTFMKWYNRVRSASPESADWIATSCLLRDAAAQSKTLPTSATTTILVCT